MVTERICSVAHPIMPGPINAVTIKMIFINRAKDRELEDGLFDNNFNNIID
jgi:hypothetical protein